MWHNFLSVLGYKKIIQSLASYSPWANIAPGVFFIARTSSKPHPGLFVLIIFDLLFNCTCLARGINILSAFAYM